MSVQQISHLPKAGQIKGNKHTYLTNTLGAETFNNCAVLCGLKCVEKVRKTQIYVP